MYACYFLFLAWQDLVQTHNERVTESFEAAARLHVQAFREAFSPIESRMVQYDAFLQ